MRILLDGYFDRNLGDDLMLALAAEGLKEYELYTLSDKINLENVTFTNEKSGFDVYLRVTGSGFLIHNNKGLFYRMRDIGLEKKYAPKRVVLSCNISPFINAAAEKIILRELREYDFITVRDSFSYNYITEKIPSARCEKYPDIVFSLPDSMIPSAENEGLLGIAVRNGVDYAALAAVADGYIEETGNGALLLCFNAGMENDELAASKIMEQVKFKDKIQIIPYRNIPDMLASMKRCRVITGARLHSLILAARMNIPFVPLAYSDKTKNALYEAGYRGVIYNAAEIDIEDVLRYILNSAPPEISDSVFSDAEKHIKELKNFLREV